MTVHSVILGLAQRDEVVWIEFFAGIDVKRHDMVYLETLNRPAYGAFIVEEEMLGSYGRPFTGPFGR